MTNHWNPRLRFLLLPEKSEGKVSSMDTGQLRRKPLFWVFWGCLSNWPPQNCCLNVPPVSVRTRTLDNCRMIGLWIAYLPSSICVFGGSCKTHSKKNMKPMVLISSSKDFLKGFFCLFSSPPVSANFLSSSASLIFSHRSTTIHQFTETPKAQNAFQAQTLLAPAQEIAETTRGNELLPCQ